MSAALVVVSVLALVFNSLQFGLDFTAGTSVRLNYSDTVILDEVNETLINNGYEDAVVVSFGSDREIRVVLPVDESIEVVDQAAQAAVVGETIAALLSENSSSEVTLLGSDYVSAKVGEELAEQGGMGATAKGCPPPIPDKTLTQIIIHRHVMPIGRGGP